MDTRMQARVNSMLIYQEIKENDNTKKKDGDLPIYEAPPAMQLCFYYRLPTRTLLT